jgi:NADPH-dependent stearoyl-CoA 9-desaturase
MAASALQTEAFSASPDGSVARPTASESDRLREFGREIDALKQRTVAQLGAKDVAHLHKMVRISNALEVTGRALIALSLDPITFFIGVVALAGHKQLETAEIGHSALHGAWDNLAGAEAYWAKNFRWKSPIDERSWQLGHNGKHHGNTNVIGRDPDVRFGFARLNELAPRSSNERWAIPFVVAFLAPNFRPIINTHVTGLNDLIVDNGLQSRFDFLPDRSLSSVWKALRRGLRSMGPYYGKEYVLYPLLAGPGFLKVLAGNALSEVLTNVYTAATILCGHVGEHVKAWQEGTRPQGRAQWYAMQVEAANDYEVPEVLSILCGGLDRQIEHHLFPSLPPPRLRQIAPEVRAICERHGIEYKTDTWPGTLKKVFRRLRQLSRSEATREVVAAMA